MPHLDTIKKFSQSSEPLLLVLGNVGAGKTELLNRTIEKVVLPQQTYRAF